MHRTAPHSHHKPSTLSTSAPKKTIITGPGVRESEAKRSGSSLGLSTSTATSFKSLQAKRNRTRGAKETINEDSLFALLHEFTSSGVASLLDKIKKQLTSLDARGLFLKIDTNNFLILSIFNTHTERAIQLFQIMQKALSNKTLAALFSKNFFNPIIYTHGSVDLLNAYMTLLLSLYKAKELHASKFRSILRNNLTLISIKSHPNTIALTECFKNIIQQAKAQGILTTQDLATFIERTQTHYIPEDVKNAPVTSSSETPEEKFLPSRRPSLELKSGDSEDAREDSATNIVNESTLTLPPGLEDKYHEAPLPRKFVPIVSNLPAFSVFSTDILTMHDITADEAKEATQLDEISGNVPYKFL